MAWASLRLLSVQLYLRWRLCIFTARRFVFDLHDCPRVWKIYVVLIQPSVVLVDGLAWCCSVLARFIFWLPLENPRSARRVIDFYLAVCLRRSRGRQTAHSQLLHGEGDEHCGCRGVVSDGSDVRASPTAGPLLNAYIHQLLAEYRLFAFGKNTRCVQLVSASHAALADAPPSAGVACPAVTASEPSWSPELLPLPSSKGPLPSQYPLPMSW